MYLHTINDNTCRWKYGFEALVFDCTLSDVYQKITFASYAYHLNRLLFTYK